MAFYFYHLYHAYVHRSSLKSMHPHMLEMVIHQIFHFWIKFYYFGICSTFEVSKYSPLRACLAYESWIDWVCLFVCFYLGWDWGPKYNMGELGLCINQQPWSFYCGKFSTLKTNTICQISVASYIGCIDVHLPICHLYTGEPPCGQLNPKNNHTYTVLEKLYGELMEATQTTDIFHLGGDEVNLECWSQYFNDTDLRALWCDFMLQAYQKLRKANKNAAPPKFVVVWSSGLTSSQCLSRNNFAVQVWGGSAWQENYDLIMNGFNIIVSHVDAWYLDCGFGSWRSTGDGACSPYTTWQRVYKHRPWDRMHLDPIKMKQVRGGCVLMRFIRAFLSHFFCIFTVSFAGAIRY